MRKLNPHLLITLIRRKYKYKKSDIIELYGLNKISEGEMYDIKFRFGKLFRRDFHIFRTNLKGQE